MGEYWARERPPTDDLKSFLEVRNRCHSDVFSEPLPPHPHCHLQPGHPSTQAMECPTLTPSASCCDQSMNAKIASAALTDPFPQRLQNLSQDPQNQALHSMLKTPTAMLIPAKIAMGITLHRTLSRDTSEHALMLCHHV